MHEYTGEEKKQTGNHIYGGKRHDQLCARFEELYNLSDTEANWFSTGVWQGIESENKIMEEKLKIATDELQALKGDAELYLGHGKPATDYSVGRYDTYKWVHERTLESLMKIHGIGPEDLVNDISINADQAR